MVSALVLLVFATGSALPQGSSYTLATGQKRLTTGVEKNVPVLSAEEQLAAGALVRLGSPPLRHQGLICFLSFSPDGRSIISQGTDGVRVWDAATGQEIRQFAARPKVSVLAADLSPDGKLLALVDDFGDGSSSIWDVATGQQLRELERFTKFPGSSRIRSPRIRPRIRFFPDGCNNRRASGPKVEIGTESEIAIWEVKSGSQIRTLQITPGQIVLDMVFCSDGGSLYSGGDDNAIHVWDLATGKLRSSIGSKLGEVGRLAISHDGSCLVSIGHDSAGAIRN